MHHIFSGVFEDCDTAYKERRMLPRQKFRGPGGKSSIERLRELGFDPIEALVEAFKEIDQECKAQANIRDKKIVRLNKDGSTKAYSADFHMACVQRRADIADKLLPYGFSKVAPEGDNDFLPELHIHLSGKDEKFVLNGQPPEDSIEIVEKAREFVASREE
jgi:hypothetical protein